MLHEFWLLQETEWSYGERSDIASLHTHPTRITVHDDLIWYIHDSLEWVETVNPSNSKNWKGTGLNMYGPTIIPRSGAAQLASSLATWATLLNNGPPILQLSGPWTYDTDEEGKKSSGKYSMITIEREVNQGGRVNPPPPFRPLPMAASNNRLHHDAAARPLTWARLWHLSCALARLASEWRRR
jgi:hypothetical protein